MESRSAGRLPQLGSLYRGFSDTLKMILSDAFLESTKHKNGHTSSGGNGTQQKHSSFVWCERTSKFSPRLDSACHLMSGGSTAGITLESFLESHENTKAKKRPWPDPSQTCLCTTTTAPRVQFLTRRSPGFSETGSLLCLLKAKSVYGRPSLLCPNSMVEDQGKEKIIFTHWESTRDLLIFVKNCVCVSREVHGNLSYSLYICVMSPEGNCRIKYQAYKKCYSFK